MNNSKIVKGKTESNTKEKEGKKVRSKRIAAKALKQTTEETKKELITKKSAIVKKKSLYWLLISYTVTHRFLIKSRLRMECRN